MMRPDLVLADYNPPNSMNGVQVAQRLRQELDGQTPFIILIGDISTETLRDIALHDCVYLNKPVKLGELTRAIEKLLANPPRPARGASSARCCGAERFGRSKNQSR
jgi:two-component system, chemotaxis family, CheB/CheR fusion protein